MPQAETVILLHGLARTARSMGKLQRKLSAHGYNVHNIRYPSTQYPIEILARDFVVPSLLALGLASRMHFVTHSMGGIILRYITQHQLLPHIGRVIMLSPPNQGSEIVDVLGDWRLFQLINGPAGRQLGTTPDSLPKTLGPADFELGVITGNRSLNLFLSRLLPGENDGKVSTASARLTGMQDYLVLPATHSLIMTNKTVIYQVLQFLEYGRFDSL